MELACWEESKWVAVHEQKQHLLPIKIFICNLIDVKVFTYYNIHEEVCLK